MIFSCTWLLVGGFSVSRNAWTILSRAWLRLFLLRYADDLMLYKHSWFAQRSINLNISSSVHSLSLSAFFEGLHVFFSGFTLDFMPGLFIAHNIIKVIKKINRNKNCKQTKYLENLNYESVWVVSVIKRRYQIKVASLFILKSTSN